eukprot:357500-Chlamydomonas_euryale.AAC.18
MFCPLPCLGRRRRPPATTRAKARQSTTRLLRAGTASSWPSRNLQSFHRRRCGRPAAGGHVEAHGLCKCALCAQREQASRGAYSRAFKLPVFSVLVTNTSRLFHSGHPHQPPFPQWAPTPAAFSTVGTHTSRLFHSGHPHQPPSPHGQLTPAATALDAHTS